MRKQYTESTISHLLDQQQYPISRLQDFKIFVNICIRKQYTESTIATTISKDGNILKYFKSLTHREYDIWSNNNFQYQDDKIF